MLTVEKFDNIMDNRALKITMADDPSGIEQGVCIAMRLLDGSEPGARTVDGWAQASIIDGRQWIGSYQALYLGPSGRRIASSAEYPELRLQSLPGPLTAAELVPVIRAWLSRCQYPNRPDIDGSVEPGGLTIELIEHGAALRISPEWRTYHK